MRRPTVSVVIPTCDRPDFLAEAIESAQAQTVDILEVIVVDDASTIDLRPALARFSDRVRYERLTERSGANVARNRGIDLARGSLVAFLDDDDLWLPEKTELQIAALEGGAEACLCGSRLLGGSDSKLYDATEVDEERLRASSPCGTSGLLATRAVLQAERFDPAIPRAQDWDLFVRLAQRRPLAYVGRPLYQRRTGHDRITTTALRKTPAELRAAALAVDKHRTWLGEDAYRRRLARVILSFLSKRRFKFRFVAAALRHAGPRATMQEIARKFRG